MNETEWNAIGWRCRRGMLELDLLLQPFFENSFRNLPPEEQKRFIEFLDSPDPDLYSWLLGYEQPPERYAFLVDAIRQRK